MCSPTAEQCDIHPLTAAQTAEAISVTRLYSFLENFPTECSGHVAQAAGMAAAAAAVCRAGAAAAPRRICRQQVAGG